MTESAASRPVRTVTVQGRDILVKQLVDTQLLLIAREAKVLQRTDVELSKKMDSVERMLTILESAVQHEEDKNYLEDLMARGELDMKELISFVTVFEAPEGTPKVRRGRAAKP